MRKSRIVAMNIIVSTLIQIITLALGMVLPRIILSSWGSEYNGFINSVITVMRYLSLLEAGVSTSTLQALYKSIGTNDDEQTSIVIKTSQSYYHKIAFVYSVLVVAISLIYPMCLNTNISYWEMFFVILFQGCTGVINFAFRAAYQQLLNAEGKFYIISIITLFTTILTYAAKIISIVIYNNIIIMQLLGVLIMAVQVIIYALYFRKKYAWINKKAPINMALLENRKYYVIQQVAGLVFNSTDTIVLSIFCGLKVASVYTIYNMVYSALSVLIGMVRSSTNFVLGQAFHESKERFAKIYTIYTSFQMTLGSFFSSCSVLLIIGFVRLYTSGINDINYINYLAAVLFSLNIMLDCSRGASLSGANVAGQAPNTTWRYMVEAGINLLVSLSLVNVIGMNGVLIGTIAAGVWRSIDSIVFFNKRVLKKSSKNELLYIAINFIIFAGVAFWGSKDLIPIASYVDFIKYGILVAVVLVLFYGFLFLLFNGKRIAAFSRSIIKIGDC